jgi:hypothetical protein
MGKTQNVSNILVGKPLRRLGDGSIKRWIVRMGGGWNLLKIMFIGRL